MFITLSGPFAMDQVFIISSHCRIVSVVLWFGEKNNVEIAGILGISFARQFKKLSTAERGAVRLS